MARVAAVLQGQAIESMRASDFDIPSAIGELIDNSLQANAKNINIIINTHDIPLPETGKQRTLIKEIICSDDGTGMESSEHGVLHSCISLGYSSRYNDRSGIGRFGVGMTYAGIRYATKIEVYSKTENSKWYYVKFDLKDSKDMELGIGEPVEKDPPLQYRYLVPGEHGTFIIWSNFDKFNEYDMYADSYDDLKSHNSKRGKGSYAKMEIDDSLGRFGLLNHWIGRTFRKFIWDGINIKLNGNQVYAFDPLYLRKDKVQFNADDVAKIMYKSDIEWHDHKIHYVFTLLPEMYREKDSLGGLGFPGRYIYDNEGISIMRANREVFYDHIPRFQEDNIHKIVWDAKDRWWGCEISFDPVLDEYFSVKNIKRGAIPVKELNAVLYNELKGLIINARSQVSEHWKEKADEENANENASQHSDAEKVAKNTKLPGKILSGKDKSEEEQKAEFERIAEGLAEDEKQRLNAVFKDQPFTIVEGRWKGDNFIDKSYINGNAALQYNLSHPFMEEFFKLRRRISDDSDAKCLTTLIDIMLMSLVSARGRQEDYEEVVVEDLWEELLKDWGRYLKSYTRTYKNEHPDSDE